MTRSNCFAALGLALLLPLVARAQAQPTVPLRTLPEAAAKSKETLGLIRGLRHLPDGRVVVNDATRRRLLVFDASLSSYTIIADSTPGAANSYPKSGGGMIPYLGDSTIFVDYTSQSLLILDEKGKVARVTAPPKPADLSYMMNGSPGVDGKGQILYRSYIRPPMSAAMMTGASSTSIQPDSAPIVRADWDTGKVDTIAKFKVASGNRSSTKVASDGTRSYISYVNPLSWVDDWTVTADGSIAIVRGQDYHIDWIAGDGKVNASPKMPYDWRKLGDEDKVAIIDSVRHLYDSMLVANPPRSTSIMNGVTTVTTMQMKYEYAPPSELPDYYPPIRTGSVLADRDGNVWILPYTSAKGGNKGIVYDVVNAKGELTERVQLPEGRSIVGFGRGGIIYMMSPAPLANPTDRPGSAGFFLERTTLGLAGRSSRFPSVAPRILAGTEGCRYQMATLARVSAS